MSTFQQIQEIIRTQLEIEANRICMDTTFDELGADSVDMVDLAMTIEDEFQIEVTEEALEQMHCVSDFVNYIDKH